MSRVRFRSIAGIISLALLAGPVWAETVALATNVSSHSSDRQAGGSIAHVRCIFERIGHSAQIRTMPWRRARRAVSTGAIDGFFTAIPIPTVERYASLSSPLVLENWYWYWGESLSGPPSSDDEAQLGAVLGSHQAAWLEQHGYTLDLRVSDHQQLLKLLLSGRIDALIADRDHLEAAARALGVTLPAERRRFLRYMPLGVYFSDRFLAQRPGFLPAFNRSIFGCASDGFAISEAERAELADWLGSRETQWLATEGLRSALRGRNRDYRDLSEARREALDRRWREAFHADTPGQVAPLIDRPLSDRLRELVVGADGLVTEAILTGRQGLNLAISDMTSDYWQGDESKFRQARDLSPGQWHFDPVRYDESTRHFQVHVSRPVFDPDSGDWLGVLILGLDVEAALSR